MSDNIGATSPISRYPIGNGKISITNPDQYLFDEEDKSFIFTSGIEKMPIPGSRSHEYIFDYNADIYFRLKHGIVFGASYQGLGTGGGENTDVIGSASGGSSSTFQGVINGTIAKVWPSFKVLGITVPQFGTGATFKYYHKGASDSYTSPSSYALGMDLAVSSRIVPSDVISAGVLDMGTDYMCSTYGMQDGSHLPTAFFVENKYTFKHGFAGGTTSIVSNVLMNTSGTEEPEANLGGEFSWDLGEWKLLGKAGYNYNSNSDIFQSHAAGAEKKAGDISQAYSVGFEKKAGRASYNLHFDYLITPYGNSYGAALMIGIGKKPVQAADAVQIDPLPASVEPANNKQEVK